MSNIKHFRDLYKNPDFYGEKLSQAEKEEIEEYHRNNPEKENKLDKKFGPTADKYYQSIEAIRHLGLKDEFKNNKEEQKIIESRKKIIFDYFAKVLDNVSRYLSQVGYLELQKRNSYDSLEKYQSAVSSSDEQRKRYHDALISNLKTLFV